LPAAAPTSDQIETSSAGSTNLDIPVVRVDPAVARILMRPRATGFPSALRGAHYTPSTALRPGDIVSVSIYETGGPSLFASPITLSLPSSQVSDAAPKTSTLPPQVVESNGQILVPFVGRVDVAGKTPAQAAKHIEKLLSAQAVQPQVIVSPISVGSNAVSVGGEVNRTGPVPLSLRGERLLDVVAAAGGTKYSIGDSDVQVIRGSVSATIPMQQAIRNPDDNIAMKPRDQVVVLRNPKTFAVMGAAAKVSQYPLDQEKVSLAEALARAGGAIDTIGDTSGIYIFREEPTALIREIAAVQPGAFDHTLGRDAATILAERTPTVYRVDFSGAEGILLAQQLPIRDKDIVLVTNATGTQLMKSLTILRGVTGVVYDLNRTRALN